ncbi:hypothetical protein LZ30DRAFT_121965 [Colletotrichum cereale]|nr:hypothetical protein LZ30DRAFT_121965 [Colletotrichum cereale]
MVPCICLSSSCLFSYSLFILIAYLVMVTIVVMVVVRSSRPTREVVVRIQEAFPVFPPFLRFGFLRMMHTTWQMRCSFLHGNHPNQE